MARRRITLGIERITGSEVLKWRDKTAQKCRYCVGVESIAYNNGPIEVVDGHVWAQVWIDIGDDATSAQSGAGTGE